MNKTQQQYRQQLTLEYVATRATLGRLDTQTNGDPVAARQREHLLNKVQRIESALDRLNNGKNFGTCQKCGFAIQPERLALLPYAELCVDCQRELERQTVGFRRPVTLSQPQAAWR